MQSAIDITWLPGCYTSHIRNLLEWLSYGEAEHLQLRTSRYLGHLGMPSPMTLEKGASVHAAIGTHNGLTQRL